MMISVAEALTLLLNLLVAGAACAGAIAAFMGLNTWREQKKWEADRELARALLIEMFKRRDAVQQIRNPFHRYNKTDFEEEDPKKRTYLVSSKMYQERWDHLVEARSRIYPLLLEADAIWGSKLSGMVQEITQLEHDLHFAIEEKLEDMNPDSYHDAFENNEARNANRRIVSWRSSGDEFGDSYAAKFSPVEELLRRKLGSLY